MNSGDTRVSSISWSHVTTSIDTGNGQLFKQSYAQFLQVNSLFPTLDERENLQEI